MRSPSLKRATWQALSREDQVCWDKMSDAAKQSIIFNHSNPPTATQTRTPQVRFQPPGRPIREANVNETETDNISDEDQFVDAAQGHER
jgi:hypothetical protein